MAQTQHALHFHGNQELIDHTPSSALAAGDIVGLGTGHQRLVGVAPSAIDANALGSLDIAGIKKVKAASAITFAAGAKVGWDSDAETAVAAGDGDEDFGLGVAVKAKVNGDDHVLVKINAGMGYPTADEGSGS